MPSKTVAAVLGAVSGIVTMIAMIRLVSGAFTGGISVFALFFCLAALVPWVGYVVWRARRGGLSRRARWVVLVLDAVGLLSVWWSTGGAVAALACAFVAFVVIWVNDLPVRPPRGEERFVRIDELQDEDPD